MDDLDHSMHIAEHDWTSFCEESEECSLLKPSIARPDSSGFSDSEDLENSNPVFSTDVKSNGSEGRAAKSSTALPVQFKKGERGEGQHESLTQVESKICSLCPAGHSLNIKETTSTGNTTGLSDKLKKEVDSLATLKQTEPNANEPHATEGAGSQDLSRVSSKEEKERWFVTVNESPARRRAAGSSGKKKRRQKRPCKNARWAKREESAANCLEMMKDKHDSEGGGDERDLEQLKQNEPGDALTATFNHELSQTRCRGDTGSEILLICNSLPEHSEPTTDRFTFKDPLQVEEGEESDEFEDGAEFLSIHSCDSVGYLSAEETHSHENTFYCNMSASTCDGYEGAGVEPTLAFPSAGQAANKTPDDNSTCEPSHTPGPKEQEVHVSAPGRSSGHQLSPDLTSTPCCVANSSETYAEAAGPTRPVYAISAFWDEMEKLTINDILQLRMSSSTPPRETRETLTSRAHGFPTDPTFLVDSVQYDLSDSGRTDASDIADSDYFTQHDESKPACSSCEFSTSDFEEEYWHFIGCSRNPSPDPPDKNRRRASDSPFLSHEEVSCTCPEGQHAPARSEGCAGQRVDQESRASVRPSWPRPMAKSKTQHNVQAINSMDFTLQSVLGNDESGLSRSWSLEDDMALTANDSLKTLTPEPVLCSTDALDRRYQISIPEVFEYFFIEDKAGIDSTCITVYNPEDTPVAPVLDCTLCTLRNETSFSALHDSQCSKEEPIPIFSCSHPTVRELTFPQPDYLFLKADCKEEHTSPVGAASHSVIAQAAHGGRAPSRIWKSLLSVRKICFHDKGSAWCRRSGAWVLPVEAGSQDKIEDPPATAVTEGGMSVTLIEELALHQGIWKTLHTRKEGFLSTLKQSDMCLVCIAFASWVLRSSNPEAPDAWKAALLANVSALSAIQFLRQYVKKTPHQDDA